MRRIHLSGFHLVAFLFTVSSLAFSAGVPGGLVRSAEGISVNTYELVLSPAYTMQPSGAYLTSEMRMQPGRDFGAGLGFGAGEVGFNFGGYANWYALPDTDYQPAFSLLGGLYFNRVAQANYFVVKVVPTVSKSFRTSFGSVTPYAGLPIAPSFRLGQADNSFTMKASLGTEFRFQSLQGMRFWAEFGVGMMNTPHEIVVAASYPFSALGG